MPKRRRATNRILLCLFGIAIAVVGAGAVTPASAEPVPPDIDGEQVPLTESVEGATDSCVDIALSRRIEQWTCYGPLLTTPDGTELLEVSPRPADPAKSGPTGDVQPFDLPDPDDYDTWCENGTICSRLVPGLPGQSVYISETKGNAAYGDEDGLIGNFDHIVRTNLNGRSARWNVTYYHDNGPQLYFPRADVLCWEQVQIFPDSNCGIHYAGAPFTINATNRR